MPIIPDSLGPSLIFEQCPLTLADYLKHVLLFLARLVTDLVLFTTVSLAVTQTAELFNTADLQLSSFSYLSVLDC